MSTKTGTPMEYCAAEVAKHNTESDCWIIIGNAETGGKKVYDISKYMDDHPGGAEILMEFAGGDADSMFEDIGHSNEARRKMAEFFIGNLKTEEVNTTNSIVAPNGMPRNSNADKRFVVVIGNKAYSSWSLRGWLACRMACGPYGFDEFKLPLSGKTATDEEKQKAREILLQHSPTGKVPALRDSLLDVTVHDSLAICLHVAESYPNSLLLPLDPAARAMCLAVSAEMHSGFEALRTHCPMNCVVTAVVRGAEALQRDDVKEDVKRLGAMWTDLRHRFGAPYHSSSDSRVYLFGHFTIADCMYAPVALRFKTYDPDLHSLEEYPEAQQYVRNLLEQEGVVEWVHAALEEGAEWKLGHYDAVADTTLHV